MRYERGQTSRSYRSGNVTARTIGTGLGEPNVRMSRMSDVLPEAAEGFASQIVGGYGCASDGTPMFYRCPATHWMPRNSTVRKVSCAQASLL